MLDFFHALFAAGGFMPHGQCYFWTPGVVWLHVVSDALIALAYFSIPLTLAGFARRRRGIDFRWIFLCFAVFILACGATHVMEIWNVWHGSYWLSGTVKALTAVASIPTAILLTRLMPQTLNLPPPATLPEVNANLLGDVGARRSAEEHVAREREFYLTLLDRFPVPIWRSDVHGECDYFNQTWLEFTGRTMPQERGQGWTAGVHPADLDGCLQTFREAFDLRQPFETEYRLRHHDGAYRWMLDHGTPFHDLEGRFAGYIGSCYDITKRKASEAALRESEARFRRLLDSNIIGAFFWSTRGEIIEANDLFLQMVGHTREEMRDGNLSWRNLTPPEYVQADEHALREISATGTCSRFEKEFIRKDGSRVSVLIGGALFEGQQEFGTSFVLDITERKRSENALRTLSHRLLQAEDEERRRIAKELHDSTAQDLVAVMMNLGLLQDALGEGEKGKGEIVADSLAILENCVNDIRTLSYVVHPPQLDETGLAGALTEYAAGFGRRAAIPVRVELPPDLERLPEEIELALFRVVQESLANVLRHSKSETATIRLTKMEDRIVLEVIDRGRGLPSAMATESPGAVGVGIAGMRERMQYFGGRLELVSGPDGMTVRAVLPLREKGR